MTIEHKTIQANGINLNVAVAGEGPLVLLCHGFPELWLSWRAQIIALSEAGYRVAAPDMRGYGDTDAPEEIEKYSVFHLVGDMVGIVHALGEEKAAVVGHDWGSYVAWKSALFRPDIFHAVAGLSVPFVRRAPQQPISMMRKTAERHEAEFYQVWFQEPGVAEKAFESDVRAMQTGMFYTCSGDAPDDKLWEPAWPKGTDQSAHFKENAIRPSWLSEEELEVYISAFEKKGYRGPLNWYRNIDRNWELTAAYEDAKIQVPALFMIGDKDLTMNFAKPAIEHHDKVVPTLTKSVVVPGVGHWIQQEAPDIVNKELLEFLGKLNIESS
ncbi:MAG: alpha/beta fold hydrolase [Methyloligellaceae bacterium]